DPLDVLLDQLGILPDPLGVLLDPLGSGFGGLLPFPGQLCRVRVPVVLAVSGFRGTSGPLVRVGPRALAVPAAPPVPAVPAVSGLGAVPAVPAVSGLRAVPGVVLAVQIRLRVPLRHRLSAQWEKCRVPVRYRVMPASRAAATTASSRTDPPGCTTAHT